MAVKSSELLTVSGILREAFRIFLRNGKLMVFITLLIQFTFSFLALANIYCLQPFISGLFIKVQHLRYKNPRSVKHLKSSLGVEKLIFIITSVELIFLIAYTIAILCSVVATTYIAATSYRRKDFNSRDLFLKIQKSCAKPMISWFFVSQLGVGYTVQVFALLSIFVILTKGSLAYAFLGVAFIFISLCFNLYIAGVWMLGFVNSVLENVYEATVEEEDNGVLVGGRMLRGSVINFLFVLLTVIFFLCYKLREPGQILAPGLMRVLVVINLICLVKIFSFMAYTVFYFRCKKICAEELGGKKGNSRVLNGSSSCL